MCGQHFQMISAARSHVYEEAGRILLVHEAAQNRPVGGVYTFAIYETGAGQINVDWSLAPQRISRVPPGTTAVYEHIPVARGGWLLDHDARQAESLTERVSWFICMVFVTIKFVVRGEDTPLIDILGQAYHDAELRYQLAGMAVTDPRSLPNISAMLRQLEPFADGRQRRAIAAVDAFAARMGEMTGRDDGQRAP